ncbi:MAG: glycosyltransferase family 4 protein [Firmicutes bacterium]|nr:glycosyltransferase family 4 protein [Bacillota bacterium]
MKKVLMIANQFPPMGGSGVQRSVKFVKHLRKFGYEPIVFTREVGNMILKDETLLKDVPDGVKIIRTPARECTELKGIMRIPGKVLGKLMIPDSARLWELGSKKAVLDVIDKEDIKIVYTTSAPYSDHLLGLYIKKNRPNVKWAVDFRDEWTNNPYTLDNPYNPIRTKIEKDMEYSVLKKADVLITNTPIMRKNFVENNNLDGDNFFVIPNGYDEEDFAGLDLSKRKNEKLTFVYTGALYGRRKPDTFFQALKELKEENRIDGNKIHIELIGNYHKDKLQAQIDSYSLTNEFEIVGYVPHDECIKHQLDSDVLVLIEGVGRGAEAFYTGKIFEYMNTGRPVLAILPENGAAADLVRESGIGIVSHTENVEAIKNNIEEYYKKWCEDKLDFEPNRKVIEKFERKALTKELADVFDKLI